MVFKHPIGQYLTVGSKLGDRNWQLGGRLGEELEQRKEIIDDSYLENIIVSSNQFDGSDSLDRKILYC